MKCVERGGGWTVDGKAVSTAFNTCSLWATPARAGQGPSALGPSVGLSTGREPRAFCIWTSKPRWVAHSAGLVLRGQRDRHIG